jgi:hypothetical protein
MRSYGPRPAGVSTNLTLRRHAQTEGRCDAGVMRTVPRDRSRLVVAKAVRAR